MSFHSLDNEARNDLMGETAAIVVPPPVVGVPRKAVAATDNRLVVTASELLSVALLVLLCDLTIYRGHGFFGFAILFAVAPFLLTMGAPPNSRRPETWCVGALLALLAAKLTWSGSVLAVAVGFALLFAFSMTQCGICPYVVATIVYGSQTVSAGFRRLIDYSRFLNRLGPRISRIAWLSFLLPLAALIVFGFIFIVANPDLMESVWSGAERMFSSLTDWIAHASFGELVFCFGALWMCAGLLRPSLSELSSDLSSQFQPVGELESSAPSPLYPAFRNTLLVVIVLFAVYLVFEFQSLWFRVFPPGFH